MSPFDPADDDLARIDRARVEAWLRAHGWEPEPDILPPAAGCWWRLVQGEYLDAIRRTAVLPSDAAGDRVRRWRDVLRVVAEAHGLHGLALWSVLVSWMAPEG